jgi:hypothetical protein
VGASLFESDINILKKSNEELSDSNSNRMMNSRIDSLEKD